MKRILSWSQGGTLRLWDAATRAAISEPLRHEGQVIGAVYSPEGKRILSWSSDKTLRLWDAATGDAIGKPLRHEDIVTGAAYSPDGKRILSWSNDKTLRLWDAATGAAIGEPLRHESWVNGAVYSPDGKRILSWSTDKTLRLWDVSWRGDDLFEIVCNYTPMMASREEIYRLSKRYGVSIDEPICQPGDKIPDPDWSRTEPTHVE
jgi:WD40 repeat protein